MVGACEPTWWKRRQQRYVHVEGWSVAVPDSGWIHRLRGDVLELASARARLMLVVADSLSEVELELSALLDEPTERLEKPDGLVFVRCSLTPELALVHVFRPDRPGAHLMASCSGDVDELMGTLEHEEASGENRGR